MPDDDPTRTARGYLRTTPLTRLAGTAAAVGAAVCLALLFPLLYVFVDLLVYQGKLPADPVPAGPLDWCQASAASSGGEVGLLSLGLRERDRWPVRLIEPAARAVPWTWQSAGANANLLLTLLGAAVTLTVVRGVLLNLTAYWSTAAALDAGVRLRRAVYAHGQRLSAVAVRPDAQAEAGDLVTRQVDDVQDGLAAGINGGIRLPVLAGLTLVTLLSSHVWLTIAILALTGLVWLLAGSAAAWFRRDARLASRRADARLGMVREAVAGTQLTKAYLMERFAQTRFERHLTELSRAAWRKQRGDTVSRPTLLTVVLLVGLMMLYLAGRVVLGGEMTVAAAVVKAAALATLVVTVGRYAAVRVRVRRGASAEAAVGEFLDRRGDVAQAVDADFLQPMAKQLDLVSLSLRDAITGTLLLDQVTLTVPAGTTAAVLAADPAEGHALAHLLTRFADPTAGEVRIDGKNTRWVTYESVRTQVALVLESGLTFSDTVAHNISCGDPIFTLPQVIAAAKVAHAHQFVQRLPYGYETRIGSGGLTLSTGERFRLALARAVLRDSSLWVIEEPAGLLDADSLVLIDDTIARIKPGRTLIFLARRPATVRAADRVFVLRHGKLAAAGDHDSLLESSELYRQLHLRQTLAAGV